LKGTVALGVENTVSAKQLSGGWKKTVASTARYRHNPKNDTIERLSSLNFSRIRLFFSLKYQKSFSLLKHSKKSDVQIYFFL
jgi:hypothetical protein